MAVQLAETMAEFLRWGRLGPVELGQQVDHVVVLFGAPEEDVLCGARDWNESLNGRRILFYGNVQVFFDAAGVSDLICIYYDLSGSEPDSIRWNGFRPNGGTLAREFESYCAAQGVAFNVNSVLTFGDQYTIRAGICDVVFATETGQVLLNKICAAR